MYVYLIWTSLTIVFTFVLVYFECRTKRLVYANSSLAGWQAPISCVKTEQN